MALDPGKRPSATRYEEAAHRVLERKRAPHSVTHGGDPTAASPAQGLAPAGDAPDAEAAHHSLADGGKPGTSSHRGGAKKKHKHVHTH